MVSQTVSLQSCNSDISNPIIISGINYPDKLTTKRLVAEFQPSTSISLVKVHVGLGVQTPECDLDVSQLTLASLLWTTLETNPFDQR